MDKKLSVSFDLTITEDDILCIMASAVYSITYWVAKVRAKDKELAVGRNTEEYIADGGDLIVYVNEPFETDASGKDVESYILNADKLCEGVRRWYVNGYDGDGAVKINGGRLMLDTGNIDGGMADIIVQFALFGEIVFA